MKQTLQLVLLAVGGCGVTIQPTQEPEATVSATRDLAGTYIGDKACTRIERELGATIRSDSFTNILTRTFDSDGMPLIDGNVPFVGQQDQVRIGVFLDTCVTTSITRSTNGIVIETD